MFQSIFYNFGFPDDFFTNKRAEEQICSGHEVQGLMEAESVSQCSESISTNGVVATTSRTANSNNSVYFSNALVADLLGEGNGQDEEDPFVESDKHAKFSSIYLGLYNCISDAAGTKYRTQDLLPETPTLGVFSTPSSGTSMYSEMFEVVRNTVGTVDPTKKVFIPEAPASAEAVSVIGSQNKRNNISAADPKIKKKKAAAEADPKNKKRKAAAQSSVANSDMKKKTGRPRIVLPPGWECRAVARETGPCKGKKFDKYYKEPIRADGAERNEFDSWNKALKYMEGKMTPPVKKSRTRKRLTAKKGASPNPNPVHVSPSAPTRRNDENNACTQEIEYEAAPILESGLFQTDTFDQMMGVGFIWI